MVGNTAVPSWIVIDEAAPGSEKTHIGGCCLEDVCAEIRARAGADEHCGHCSEALALAVFDMAKNTPLLVLAHASERLEIWEDIMPIASGYFITVGGWLKNECLERVQAASYKAGRFPSSSKHRAELYFLDMTMSAIMDIGNRYL